MNTDTNSTGAPNSGITVVVRRRVQPEAVGEFEAWLDGILAATATFDGHLGASVARPAGGAAQDYVVIFRFDTAANLAAWEHSEERADWLSRVDAFTLGPVEVRRITGLEYWFSLPDDAEETPPPAWKMAIVTVVGLFPLVHFLAPALLQRMGGLPPLLASFVTIAALVALMTWGVMPLLIRVARPWLFPAASGADPVNELHRPPSADGVRE